MDLLINITVVLLIGTYGLIDILENKEKFNFKNRKLNKKINDLEKYIKLRCPNILLFAENSKSIVHRFNTYYYNHDNYAEDYLNKNIVFDSFYSLSNEANSRTRSNSSCKTLNNLMYNCFIDDIDNIIQDLFQAYGYDKKRFLKDLCWERDIRYNDSLTLRDILDRVIIRSKLNDNIKCSFMKDIIGLFINYNYYFRYEGLNYQAIRRNYNTIMTYIFYKHGNYFIIDEFDYKDRLNSIFFKSKIKKFIK